MPPDFDWIFFDCFNTLIDDFDPNGDESGLGTLPDIAVRDGFFTDRSEFIAVYRAVRAETVDRGKEMLLADRLYSTLRRSSLSPTESEVAATTATMLTHWAGEYRNMLRLTPGAADTVEYWSARKPLGVISNFFWPGLPARYLEEFGLAQHFHFIVDSAELGIKKPHPDIFHHALELAGLTPAQSGRVLMVGDRLNLDINTPAQLGFQVLHFNRRKTRPDVTDTPIGIPRIYDLDCFRIENYRPE